MGGAGKTVRWFALMGLLSSALVAGCISRVREDTRDPSDLLRVAVENTFALRSVRVAEETVFPSSEELMSTAEAKALGTGVWTRVVEFVSPDRVHYSSSSEDGGLEAYRVGPALAYRLLGLEEPGAAGDQEGSGAWTRVESVAEVSDEVARSELEWLFGVTGVESILNGGLRDAENVTKVGEEDVDRIHCAVLRIDSPAWLRRFETSLAEAGLGGKPVKYEVKAWVSLRGEALILKIEDAWVYREPGSGSYEYTISTRAIEPSPDLDIELP